ncbi:MAG: guanylate kinase [Clostridia bacterium]|nr:guanylate kinase [Clostridia bacterium]
MNFDNKGLIFIISGPAGSGKSTIVKKLLATGRFEFSVSATTRAPRPGEEDGVQYHFITHEKFDEMLKDDMFLEHAEYVGNCYGTPKKPVEDWVNAGKNVILEIEVIGALQVKEKKPEAIMIFITPPDAETLEARLRGRGTEDEAHLLGRLAKARREFESFDKYDYAVINEQESADKAAEVVLKILDAEEHRTSCNKTLFENFFN